MNLYKCKKNQLIRNKNRRVNCNSPQYLNNEDFVLDYKSLMGLTKIGNWFTLSNIGLKKVTPDIT